MHPCRSCGACCAAFRVRFPAREAREFGVPPALTQPFIRDHLELRRTGGVCTAHVGVVGEDSTCGIYANRPGPCRDFVPAWEHGEPNESCDRARAQIGLAPLKPGWATVPVPGTLAEPVPGTPVPVPGTLAEPVPGTPVPVPGTLPVPVPGTLPDPVPGTPPGAKPAA